MNDKLKFYGIIIGLIAFLTIFPVVYLSYRENTCLKQNMTTVVWDKLTINSSLPYHQKLCEDFNKNITFAINQQEELNDIKFITCEVREVCK